MKIPRLNGPNGSFQLNQIKINRKLLTWSFDSEIQADRDTKFAGEYTTDNIAMRWIVLASFMLNGYPVSRQFFIKNGVSRRKIDLYLETLISKRFLIKADNNYIIEPKLSKPFSGNVWVNPTQLFNKELTALKSMKLIILLDHNRLSKAEIDKRIPKSTFHRWVRQLKDVISYHTEQSGSGMVQCVFGLRKPLSFWVHKSIRKNIKASYQSEAPVPSRPPTKAPESSEDDQALEGGTTRHWRGGRLGTGGGDDQALFGSESGSELGSKFGFQVEATQKTLTVDAPAKSKSPVSEDKLAEIKKRVQEMNDAI